MRNAHRLKLFPACKKRASNGAALEAKTVAAARRLILLLLCVMEAVSSTCCHLFGGRVKHFIAGPKLNL